MSKFNGGLSVGIDRSVMTLAVSGGTGGGVLAVGAGGREGGGVDEAVVSGMTLTVVSEASSNKSRAFFALPITLSPPNKQMSYSLKYFDEKRERNRRIKGGRKKDIQLRKSSEAEDKQQFLN
ncbi:MAG: hypothetical protein N2V73_00945 [Candidatus Methanospirare jalkutatii]|nr:hypothetical protein [Candidatus Methanospirare jalkutatii]